MLSIADTSRDVWLCLEKMFTSQSRARQMQLHHQISTLKKGDSSIADYFHKFTTLADTLAAIEHPLSDYQLVSFFMSGLGSEYDPHGCFHSNPLPSLQP
jgi:hypothetical protein